MSNPSVPTKVTGDTLSATEVNSIVTSIGTKLDSSGAYVLPIATDSVLGGVKQGANVTIDEEGFISVADPASPYTLPIATDTVLGGVKQGNNISIGNTGVLSFVTDAKTGTALSFVSDAIYGSTATPETGNITGVTTNAKPGAVILLIHNNGSTPTFDVKFKKLSGSGDYVTGQINYIMCMYLDSTHIIYSINQAL